MSNDVIQLEPKQIIENVNKTADILASFIVTVKELEYKIEKNNLKSTSDFSKTVEEVKEAINMYTKCYQDNLANITKGVITLEDLENRIANSIDKLESTKSSSNRQESLGWQT